MFNDLLKGNARFMASPSFAVQRQDHIESQDPPTILLSCSDSRVPAQYIFDSQIGDIFEVENGGNITGHVALDSIQYALDNFDVRDIIVLCHENCGAVSGVYQMVKNNEDIKYDAIYNQIAPSIVTKYDSDKKNILESTLNNCVNSKNIIKQRTHPKSQCRIHTAYYHLGSGKVTFF